MSYTRLNGHGVVFSAPPLSVSNSSVCVVLRDKNDSFGIFMKMLFCLAVYYDDAVDLFFLTHKLGTQTRKRLDCAKVTF